MRNGIQKAIWLHICRHGGTWTPDEIAAAFKMDRQRANVLMQNMATRSKTLARRRQDGRAAFAITGSCCIPEGVTLDEIRGVSVGPAPRQRPAPSVFHLAEVMGIRDERMAA